MIAWGSLGIEFVVSLVFAAGLVSIFALGLRLLAVGAPDEARLGPDGSVERVADGEVAISHQRPTWASFGAYLCFAIAVAVVLYGIYLIIPQFHQ
ncbi:hypothetical protein [Gryllotalpicola protaetiae]|uniref:Uncharacterized protein n=1 Tax=Gryllotalpicola protaetiae TaxID=2419771 RepID=A0A387BKF0_9MICO|nr:hypothetical protein [Gryllotalpicola protaetiae]AYG02782.1 hypothetical protein D7I44_04105 [Gryllotalpicola protaetiae]